MQLLFSNVVEYFIHPKLRTDKSIYQKARLSVIVFLIVYFITIIYISSYFAVADGVYFDFKSILNYADFVATTIALIIIKTKGSVNFSLGFMAYTYFILMVCSIYVSGGINSYDIFWLIVLCAASFMFVSETAGIVIAVLSLLSVTAFYVIEQFGILSFHSNAAQMTLTYKFYNFFLILCLLVLMIYVLIRGNKKLLLITQLMKEQKIREEIARDFHDQIGNKLASLRHLAELTKMKKTQEEKDQILTKIDNNAKDVYDNFRDFIWTLDVKSDHLNELFMYLRDFADDCFKYSNVNLYTHSIPETLPDIILEGSISKEVVPVFKEAITNIQKHASAKNVRLEFIYNQYELKIKLSDDGIGFDYESTPAGFGLRNIKVRSQRAGGTLVVISQPNKGTDIVFTVKTNG